jgi:hypothetical protein
MTPMERFNALTKRQQDEILDKHRHHNTEELEWWGAVYDDFKADMDKVGIYVHRMYFSGFSSQGDGACFEGNVDDWPKFLESLGHTSPALITLANTGWKFAAEHKGHYYHENCARFDACLNTLDCHDAYDEEDFANVFSPYKSEIQTAAWMALIADYKRLDIEEELEGAFKSHMRDLYNRLKVEYDALTSDESVLEALHANDMLDEIIDELENEYA